MTFHRFKGKGVPAEGAPKPRQDGCYVPSAALITAVNTALSIGRPLLVTGEPGVGKTSLAEAIAIELGLGKVLEFHTRSDHQARDVLYSFDNLKRFFDVQTKNDDAKLPQNYRSYGKLGEAIRSGRQQVVLIDEIDKAPRDFPNDLLNVIDRMEFDIPETGEHHQAEEETRPIVVITSNAEKRLPEPFLRRCVFHFIDFPGKEDLTRIMKERLPREPIDGLYEVARKTFEDLRTADLSRKPSIDELLSWVRVLIKADPTVLAQLKKGELPFPGALLKSEEDLAAVLKRFPVSK